MFVLCDTILCSEHNTTKVKPIVTLCELGILVIRVQWIVGLLLLDSVERLSTPVYYKHFIIQHIKKYEIIMSNQM